MAKNNKIKGFLLFISLLLIFFLFNDYIFALKRHLSWENFRYLYDMLENLKSEHPILTPFAFMGTYILYTLLSLPGIFLFSLIAGCLFAQPLSTLYVTFAATLGGSLVFLIARTAFGNIFYRNNNEFFLKMKDGFARNAASYLLFLRLVPFSPFWIINISGAFFKVPLWTFIWTTFLGMLPSVLIYTHAGEQLGVLLQSPDPLNPANLFDPTLVFSLLALAILPIIPVIYRFSIKSPD